MIHRLRQHYRRLRFRLRIRPETSTAELVRLGSDYGGWWIPKSMLRPGVIAYCVGAGEDVSFDLALLAHGASVRTVDPTPRSIEFVRSLSIDDSASFEFIPVALWNESGTLRLYAPRNPDHVSYSALNLQRTADSIEVPAMSLEDLLAEVGDTHLDILKLDIEGAELMVLPDVVAMENPPSVLCIEFDAPQELRLISAIVSGLRDRGYSIARVEGLNVLLVRSQGMV